MLKISKKRVAAAMAPFERLVAALSRKATREKTLVCVLACYAVVWTLVDFLARRPENIHYDMGEMLAWSNDFALGSPKHPQMGAWIAGLWFRIFPRQDWGFYLLANVLVAVAFWCIWRLSERWLNVEKRIVGLAFIMLIPFFNLFAWKYNANTILVPLWAITALAFFRSIETRNWKWAAAAGVAAAAAMMGKYWSIFLIAGLTVAAFVDPERRAYFRSSAPVVTVAAGFAALAPHLYWIATHGFSSLEYATHRHLGHSFMSVLGSAATYLVGFGIYAALPMLLLMVCVRPKLSTLSDVAFPKTGERRTAVAAFWLPLLLPIPVAILLRERIQPNWTMSACLFLPILLLASPKLRISRAITAQFVAVAAAFSLFSLAIAPARAVLVRNTGAPHAEESYKLVARAVNKEWHRTTGLPLGIFGSYSDVVYGASFYLPGRPSVLNILNPGETPLVTKERIAREGAALVCPVLRVRCVSAAESLAAEYRGVRRVDPILTRHYRGAAAKSQRYIILVIPPAET